MTKITIITHDDGKVEVQGEKSAGTDPFDLLIGLHAHVDCIATLLKQPKLKVIANMTMLCQKIDENQDKINQKSVEINLPHDFKKGRNAE